MASKTTNYNLDMPGYDEIADIDVINGNMNKIDVQMKKNADSAQQSKDIVSDEYSATNTYAVGDYCIHENVLYKCKTAITTGEAFDSSKWVHTTCGTEFRELNSNLTKKLDVFKDENSVETFEIPTPRNYGIVIVLTAYDIFSLIYETNGTVKHQKLTSFYENRSISSASFSNTDKKITITFNNTMWSGIKAILQ